MKYKIFDLIAKYLVSLGWFFLSFGCAFRRIDMTDYLKLVLKTKEQQDQATLNCE